MIANVRFGSIAARSKVVNITFMNGRRAIFTGQSSFVQNALLQRVQVVAHLPEKTLLALKVSNRQWILG